jgi:DNA repair exonuclease SbcCD ATPase subunit
MFKQEVSVEKFKADMIKGLNHKTAEATNRLDEVNRSITSLSEAIEEAEKKEDELEARLKVLQEYLTPDKKTLEAISALITEVQAYQQTRMVWRNNLETLQAERNNLLYAVKGEVERILDTIKKELQKKVNVESEKLLAFLVSTEEAIEECRKVDNYVPCLKGVQEVVCSSAYYMECPPVALWVYLRGKMKAIGGLS